MPNQSSLTLSLKYRIAEIVLILMKFSIEQNEKQFQISVAHFVVGEDYSEAIHGHNIGVRVIVSGQLNKKTRMVIDFLKLNPLVEKLLEQWDHRTLIPSKSSEFTPTIVGSQVEWTHRGKAYSIPKDDVLLLPISNVTVEELANLFVNDLAKEILNSEELKQYDNVEEISVTVFEYPWQSATASFNFLDFIKGTLN